VVLVQTSRNLLFPHVASTKFIEVPALGHRHISSSQLISAHFVSGEFNLGDFSKIEISILHVRYTKVRSCLEPGGIVAFSQGNTCLKRTDRLQFFHLPMVRDFPQPFVAGVLVFRIWL
jgi:hypothetical protein